MGGLPVMKPSLDGGSCFRQSGNMEQNRAAHAFATLGHPGRLAVFPLNLLVDIEPVSATGLLHIT
jgi:hypothetical protein